MMITNVDAYVRCVARFGENQSGDAAHLFDDGDTVTAVLVDSGGAVMHACVLAGMVVGMFETVLSHSPAAEEAVSTVVDMLPAGGAARFTVVQVQADGAVSLARLAMPAPVYLRRGHVQPLQWVRKRRGSCVLEEAHFHFKSRDTLVCFGSGVAQAGDGVPYAVGWNETLLPAYLEAAYKPSIPACKLGELLLNVSGGLLGPKPQNDRSVAVLRYDTTRGRSHAVL